MVGDSWMVSWMDMSLRKLGDSESQESLRCFTLWDHKESDTT